LAVEILVDKKKSSSDGRAPSYTQAHNNEEEDLEVVYGFICTYGSNWAFFFVGPIKRKILG